MSQEVALCCCLKADEPPEPPPPDPIESCTSPNCSVCLPSPNASVTFSSVTMHLNVPVNAFGSQSDFEHSAFGTKTFTIFDGPDPLEPCIWQPQPNTSLDGVLSADPEWCKDIAQPPFFQCTPFGLVLSVTAMDCVVLDDTGESLIGTKTAWHGLASWIQPIPTGFGQTFLAGVAVEYLLARNAVCLGDNSGDDGYYRIISSKYQIPVVGQWTPFGTGSSIQDPTDQTVYQVSQFSVSAA